MLMGAIANVWPDLFGGIIAGQVGVGPMMQLVAVATLVVFWGGTALLEPRLRHVRVRAAPSSTRG